MWRKVLSGLGCLGYLLGLAVLFAAVSYTSFSIFVRRGVTPTPELLGLPEEEARALLADQGLRMGLSDDDRYDEEVQAGHALAQKPQAGTLVKRGSTVTVTLSRGPQRLLVPTVAGSAVQAALVTLSASGLTLGRTMSIYSDAGAAGTVVAQYPGAGTRVEPGGAVDLFVALSSPTQTYLMPDLINRPYDAVQRFFAERGYRLGRVGYENYAGIPAGTVLRQFPRAGYPLARGDVISLDVASGE